MEKNQQLMKHFSVFLKNRASGKITPKDGVSDSLLKHFSRKELIEVLTRKGNGKIPSEWNIAELENEELLSLIGDEMFILSYYVEQWAKGSNVIPKQSLNNVKTEHGKGKTDEQTKS